MGTYNDSLYIASAVKAQQKVGALRNRRAENAERQRKNRNAAKDGLKIERPPSGKRGQGGRGIGDTTIRSGGKLQRPGKEKGKGIGNIWDWIRGAREEGSSTSSLTGLSGNLSKASMVLDSIVELEKAFGEGDIITMGSGHTYSSGYNPEMYIGQGPGY